VGSGLGGCSIWHGEAGMWTKLSSEHLIHSRHLLPTQLSNHGVLVHAQPKDRRSLCVRARISLATTTKLSEQPNAVYVRLRSWMYSITTTDPYACICLLCLRFTLLTHLLCDAVLLSPSCAPSLSCMLGRLVIIRCGNNGVRTGRVQAEGG